MTKLDTELNTNMAQSMYVVKRTGEREEVSFDKCLKRIQKLSKDLKINPIEVSQLIITQIYDGVETWKLDELAADICAAKTTQHPDYGHLASRIIVSNHHKNTSPSYSEVIQTLWDNKDVLGNPSPLINPHLFKTVMDNKEKINTTLDYEKDFNYDYFGFKTLERAYLMRINGKVIERPQHMLMRVALSIHKDDLKEALKVYKIMSDGYFTHATPTLFNMGTNREQASSCFLLQVDEDSVDGIFKTMADCAKISKHAGGIGVSIHKIRAKGSIIRGTNGNSDGIVPMLKCFNEVARYINQCFTPDTMVYTQKGVKRMDEITSNDYLLTNDIENNKNEFKKVNGISINNIDKEIYEICGKYAFESVKVTGEHEIYVLQGQTKVTNFKIIRNRLDKKIIEPKFITVEELNENDMFGYPIPTYENDYENYDDDFCRFYGIMIGDGHIYKRNNAYEYGITFGKTKKINTLDFVKNYLVSKNIHYWTCVDENKNTISIRWSSKLINITYDMLYDNNKVKKIDNSFIHLPISKTLNLIKGLIETDGCIYKEICFTNTSYQVVMTLRYLLLRIGVLSSGYLKNDVGKGHYIKRENDKMDYIENKLICYEIRIPKDKKLKSIINNEEISFSDKVGYFEHNGIIWSRVRKIKKINYSGPVYDFNMIDNHNYTVSSLGLVHNSGRRAGSFAFYLEPWHADIEDFLRLRLNTGIEEERARDLFYAIWMPDLFMKRVEEDGDWTLMCPDKCPNLYLVYGEEFEKLYEKYEREGLGNKTIKARILWEQIINTQIETGLPYIGYKDAINKKNNQKNLGTIQSSNLCIEICEYTSHDEIAVCNLASIALPKYIEHKDGKNVFNFEKFREVVKMIVRNLNKIIDYNYYPVKEAETSNRKNRPIGTGIQGLYDLFCMLKIAFDSDEARKLNRQIFENMYYAALESSMELSRKRAKYVREYKRLLKLGSNNNGELSDEDKKRLEELKTQHFILDEELKLPNQYAGAYSTFIDSPLHKGQFQFEMWDTEPSPEMKEMWENLRSDINKHGVRNSLLIAIMPTASTSQILGYTECIEPVTNNIYTRRTLAGTFMVVNKYLINDLLELGLWNNTMKDKIIVVDGSVQEIPEIPQELKDRYKTVWEIKMKTLIDLAADRAPFICQTQSLNAFVKNPTFKTINSMHFYGWKKGLKTGMYYLRSLAKTSATKFSVDLENVKSDEKKQIEGKKEEKIEVKVEVKEEEGCLMCSS